MPAFPQVALARSCFLLLLLFQRLALDFSFSGSVSSFQVVFSTHTKIMDLEGARIANHEHRCKCDQFCGDAPHPYCIICGALVGFVEVHGELSSGSYTILGIDERNPLEWSARCRISELASNHLKERRLQEVANGMYVLDAAATQSSSPSQTRLTDSPGSGDTLVSSRTCSGCTSTETPTV